MLAHINVFCINPFLYHFYSSTSRFGYLASFRSTFSDISMFTPPAKITTDQQTIENFPSQ